MTVLFSYDNSEGTSRCDDKCPSAVAYEELASLQEDVVTALQNITLALNHIGDYIYGLNFDLASARK